MLLSLLCNSILSPGIILFIKKFLKQRAWEYSNSAAHIRNLTYHFITQNKQAHSRIRDREHANNWASGKVISNAFGCDKTFFFYQNAEITCLDKIVNIVSAATDTVFVPYFGKCAWRAPRARCPSELAPSPDRLLIFKIFHFEYGDSCFA